MKTALLIWMLCSAPIVQAETPQNLDYSNLINRARSEYRSGRLLAAEASFLSALQTLKPTDQKERAAALSELGDVYLNEDMLSMAERTYAKSLTIYQSLSDSQGIAIALRNLGAVYSLQRRDGEAIRVLQQSLKVARTKPIDPGITAQALNSIGVSYFRQGKAAKAESYFNEALLLVLTSGIPFDRGELLNNLGAVYYTQRKFEKAERALQQALREGEQQLGGAHPDLTLTLAALGALYTTTENYAEAENQYARALAILQSDEIGFARRIARILHELSATYKAAGQTEEADSVLAQAAGIAREHLRQHPDMAPILEDYARVLERKGRTGEAKDLRGEVQRSRVTAGLVSNVNSPH